MQLLFDTYRRIDDLNVRMAHAALRLHKIGTRAEGLLAQQRLTMVEACLHAGAEQLRTLAAAPHPKETVTTQAQIATELGDRLVAAAGITLDVQAQLRAELLQWVEDELQTARAERRAEPAQALEAAA